MNDETTTVEGFSNYATFGVAVTLDNDREYAAHVRKRIMDIRQGAPGFDQVQSGIWTLDQAIRFYVADFLKDYTARLCEQGAPSLMATQMVQAGLAEVDWRELADHELTE